MRPRLAEVDVVPAAVDDRADPEHAAAADAEAALVAIVAAAIVDHEDAADRAPDALLGMADVAIVPGQVDDAPHAGRDLRQSVLVVPARLEHRRDLREVVAVVARAADHGPADAGDLARGEDRTVDGARERLGQRLGLGGRGVEPDREPDVELAEGRDERDQVEFAPAADRRETLGHPRLGEHLAAHHPPQRIAGVGEQDGVVSPRPERLVDRGPRAVQQEIEGEQPVRGGRHRHRAMALVRR